MAFKPVALAHSFNHTGAYLGAVQTFTPRIIASLFVMLLFGAFLFSLERMLFADASYILFRIINQGSLQIQEHRYGSFITQGIPLLASKAGLSLPVVLVLYSLSFNLFYLAVVLLLLYRFRETGLALLMSFYFLLFVSDAYFWTNNEVHQGIAWMFLWLALTLAMGKRKASPWLLFPIFLLFAFLSIFTHPLVFFPAAFLWVFFMLRQDWPFSRNITVLLSLLLLVIVIAKWKLSTGGSSHYDVEKLKGVQEISLDRLKAAFTSPMVKELLKRTLTNYWLVPLLFAWGCLAAWKGKRYRLLLLNLAASGTYIIAICLTFSDFLHFYTESEWMPFTIIVTALFVYEVAPGLKPALLIPLLVLIFTVRLTYIGFASAKWTARKEWLLNTTEALHQSQITKAVIYPRPEMEQLLIMNWGLPVESLLASSLQGHQPATNFLMAGPESVEEKLSVEKTSIAGPFENWSSSILHPSYFKIDTSGTYRVVQPDSTLLRKP